MLVMFNCERNRFEGDREFAFCYESIFHSEFIESEIDSVFWEQLNISIPRQDQMFYASRFSDCKLISFERDSEMERIESKAFYCWGSLNSIAIPRHVQILCLICFSDYNSLSFEADLKLTLI
jgi:hypothetical protein